MPRGAPKVCRQCIRLIQPMKVSMGVSFSVESLLWVPHYYCEIRSKLRMIKGENRTYRYENFHSYHRHLAATNN